MDSEGTVTFYEELPQRATAMGWIMGTRNILTIPVLQGAGAPPINRPLLMQYGLIKISVIKAHALTYVQAINSCQAQNNMMWYTCILNILTKDGRKKITSEPQSYHVHQECHDPSGAMLFKLFMNKALVDNRTTTTLYCNNLISIEVHMGVVNSNIEHFNQFVQDNGQALKNRGHDIDKDDMVECLLQAYLVAHDSKFNNYVTLLQTNFNDGTSSLNAEQLMCKAFDFYKP